VNYKEVEFFDTDAGKKEILIAFLGEIGFETFQETDDGLKAYIPEQDFDEKTFDEEITGKFNSLSFSVSSIPQQNWNEVWEKNFEPVQVGDVYIRAPFHESRKDVKHELVIEPKMSFGTGHHATTSLMILEMLKTDFRDKSVLDMGCGTSLLAILASKSGAGNILAIDIDDWAVENSAENCARNKVFNVEVQKGNATAVQGRLFNNILANINRNVLLEDMKVYAEALLPGGEILFSGFYETDIDAIRECAESYGLVFKSSDSLNQWAVLKFKK
jgi:ribosomal protein L11 methyltransferase